MKNEGFDVIIVGAGPGGCACALSLAASGLNIALIDKDTFPRDKICGDALSSDVIYQLDKLPGRVQKAFEAADKKSAIYEGRVFSPNAACLELNSNRERTDQPPLYIMKRWDFDHLLIRQVKTYDNIHVFENCRARQVMFTEDAVHVVTENRILEGKVAIGADGAHSILARHAGIKVENRHYSAGLRAYYENVEAPHARNYVELHLFNDILPGYFWIFSLPDNQVNVGIGMLSSAVSKKKVRLKGKLQEIINEHPAVAPRFRHALQKGEVKGFGLPLGSKKRRISGERFLLIGDAASLIDPFTGEGIGNALRSGRFAAAHLVKGFQQQDFSASFNRGYDAVIYQAMWGELRFRHVLQKLYQYPSLPNALIKQANRRRFFRMLLGSLFEGIDLRNEWYKPSFYRDLWSR